jgi:hypothetical protein
MQVVAQGTVENSKDDLNALCLMFCVTVEEHIFFNGQDWIAECTAFCKTLCETLTFMPNDTLLCEEIKAFLLNPQDNPSGSCNDQVAEILQILRSQMRQHSSASGFSGQCAVCSGASGSGIWTRCAGRGCVRVFHVRCASSKLLSKKHSSIYYRCEICAAREIEITVDGRERKRQKISRDDGRISCETSGGLAEFSASVRAAAASSASDASTAAGCKCPEVLAALHAVPASDTASAAASSPATAATLDTSMFLDNVSAAETDVLVDACKQLLGAKDDLRKVHEDMQTDLRNIMTKSLQIRTALSRISSAIGEFNDLTRGIESVDKMSSVLATVSTDVTEHAIRILVALDSGLHLTSEQMEGWYATLRNRGTVLYTMYREEDYNVMVEETISLLKQYSGRQILCDKDFAALREHLETYGWVLSPQMWTREEIAVMCVILLDPELQFNIILQKRLDMSLDDERKQNRGMACLDPRVQAIMYSRLKHYRFVQDGHLPSDVPAAVVLNSGGSYLNLGTWVYCTNSRFVVDEAVLPLLFEVTKTPAYTQCDGLYIATKTRRPNGQPVYVGISPTQFFGVSEKDKPLWDSEPMVNCLSNRHTLRKYFDPEDCDGKTFAAERLLYWENGQAVFQSVTAYGTDMKLMTVECETLCSHSKSNWSRIENFDFKNKKSIMVAISARQRPEISFIKVKGNFKKPDYTFACGTKRIVLPVKRTRRENKPNPTKKQCMHKDGPTMYDTKQFDERGNILPGAREYTVRNTPLPSGISVSALFAFFCRTFLGIKPVEAGKKKSNKELERSCESNSDVSLRLHASIGRAIIFAFDTDHQVWNMNNV